jgi:UDP-N-acetylmuramoylalanine--D-glutamate ligase
LMTITDSPEVAVVTNLSPNHLDMHKDMEEYTEAKENIFKFQNSRDRVVLNKDNETTNSMRTKAAARVEMFSIREKIENGAYFHNDTLYINGREVCRKEEVKMRGMHNIENLLAAFCAVSEDASIESMRYVAVNFTNVEHRIEFVRELNGVKYYNDSIATSPTRTISGLNSFERPVILIAGGYDKHIPFEPLAEEGYKKIKTLVLVGATKNVIKETFEKVLKEKGTALPIIIADTFEDAVYKAKESATAGDVITLSPACAAFDMFDNFETRGKKFKEIVMSME